MIVCETFRDRVCVHVLLRCCIICAVLCVEMCGSFAQAPPQVTPTPQHYTAFEEPLKPNERRIPREEFTPEMEVYWGITLSEIEDERFVRKEHETLHITAGGSIIIKKHTDTYHGETGQAYDSDEEMFTTEGRWAELREYQEKIRAKLLPGWRAIVAAAQPRIVLRAQHPSVNVGEELILHIAPANVPPEVAVTGGISLGYDSDLLRLEDTVIDAPMLVTDSRNRAENGRGTIRIRFTRPDITEPGQGVGGINLRFMALQRGTALIEPLSIEARASAGKTFLQIGDSIIAPIARPVHVQIR